MTDEFPQVDCGKSCLIGLVEFRLAPGIDLDRAGSLDSASTVGFSTWFAALLRPTTRSRTIVDWVFDDWGMFDLRSRDWVWAAVIVGTANNKPIRIPVLFIATLISMARRFDCRARTCEPRFGCGPHETTGR